jgi:RNA polymerase sigma factor for flagellar operon FliA
MLRYSSSTTYQDPKPFLANSYAGDARETLIIDHLPKVRYIADRIAAKLPPSVDGDDLYGAGVIGLIDAVERYDGSRGVAFTTFAEMRVRGAILDNLRSLDWASRSSRRRAREIQAAYGRIEQQNGRAATEEEVAADMKISVAELRESLQEIRGLKITNLDECDEETGLSLADIISDRSATQLDAMEQAEQKRLLAAAIGKLPERERMVIALYYVEELTMKEIAEVLGVTESRVSQLKSQAAARLRATLSK